jgi:monovalent cation:H+ antiporter-2, CPA2 family
MADIPPVIFFNFSLFLLIPFIFALILKKNKISPLIGYILGGIVLGNFFGSLLAKDMINNFAYFGIMLLIFAVGLETQFDKMIMLKKFIVIGGLLQMVLTIMAITLLSYFFGFSLLQSSLIGLALASSSTTIVAKIIEERGEEGSFQGELEIGRAHV